jgi:hypothetical protein
MRCTPTCQSGSVMPKVERSLEVSRREFNGLRAGVGYDAVGVANTRSGVTRML